MASVRDAAWDSWEDVEHQRKALTLKMQETGDSAAAVSMSTWRAGDAGAGDHQTLGGKSRRPSEVLGRWRGGREARSDANKTFESLRSCHEVAEGAAEACVV